VEVKLDWDKLEEVVERAVRKARTEELKDVAEALKRLAEYMKTGFEATNKALEGLLKAVEELRKAVDEMRKTYDERLKSHEEQLKKIEVTLGSIRRGRDLEKMVLEIFKEALERRGIEPDRVEKLTLEDEEGVRLEIDVYIHDGRAYLIEVKSRAELAHVEWFSQRARLAAEALAKQGKKVERLILVAVHVDEEALERARQLGIDVIYGNVLS
jgi:septal ring factor EnvC (AmiA/AmiB activator)